MLPEFLYQGSGMFSQILSFEGTNGKIAYNPTTPFRQGGKEYIGVRAEPPESELDSAIFFACREKSGEWKIDLSLPSFPLQDPAVMKIGENLVLAGVYAGGEEESVRWRTDFYCGP
jgi:hypothetical protein